MSQRARAVGRWAAYLRGSPLVLTALATLAVAGGLGCATKADLYKLEERVIDAQRAQDGGSGAYERIAELSAEIEAMQSEQRRLEGQLEVAQKTAANDS